MNELKKDQAAMLNNVSIKFRLRNNRSIFNPAPFFRNENSPPRGRADIYSFLLQLFFFNLDGIITGSTGIVDSDVPSSGRISSKI